ncbi:hypothetical protein B0T24DRAFT_187487 [Lasiosphaeria ovina]|uniref:Uncharacterized protein n=1 Tax=Lasiosphaeria ovina TaxID=92902 RepID=A0AAE0NEX9_9PEZI|nr:hypothetical protein B0T24DRAFT_187487 [Lasiosphaeria ovina]
MERDSRRDRSQWRGCHTFKDIICDGDAGSIPKRNGGLKMGSTYYYYYELDGASETHDPTLPSTSTCPYLPGQTVNTLWVPVEQSTRTRSASLNSMSDDDYKTMNPADKFVSPRPAPPVPSPEMHEPRRVGSAPLRLQQQHKRSARSLSPGSNWTFSPRKLFSRKASSSSLKDAIQPPAVAEDARSFRSSDGSRSRDISPESLRKFLVEDVPLDEESEESSAAPVSNDWSAIAIPEDIVEENEDDDNFATSAVSESMAFTGLSPPPSQQRSPSPQPRLTTDHQTDGTPAAPTRHAPQVPPPQLQTQQPQSRFSVSDSSFYTNNSPQSPDSNSLPSFYHSEEDDNDDEDDDDEEEVVDEQAEATAPRKTSSAFARSLTASFSTYSLPPQEEMAGAKAHSAAVVGGSSPAILTTATATKTSAASFLASSTIPNAGLDDLVSELGWIADIIRDGGSGSAAKGI